MKKEIKVREKKLSVALSSPKRSYSNKKVRLAIDCLPEERKYIKMMAAHEDETLNEFVLEAVRMRVKNCCSKSHIPNSETKKALDATERGEGLIYFDSIDDFFKTMNE